MKTGELKEKKKQKGKGRQNRLKKDRQANGQKEGKQYNL